MEQSCQGRQGSPRGLSEDADRSDRRGPRRGGHRPKRGSAGNANASAHGGRKRRGGSVPIVTPLESQRQPRRRRRLGRPAMGNKLLIRAYNVGCGDCFYVCIPNKRDGFHILIDCGKKGGAEPMLKDALDDRSEEHTSE